MIDGMGDKVIKDASMLGIDIFLRKGLFPVAVNKTKSGILQAGAKFIAPVEIDQRHLL
jgi:hypothetical protein